MVIVFLRNWTGTQRFLCHVLNAAKTNNRLYPSATLLKLCLCVVRHTRTTPYWWMSSFVNRICCTSQAPRWNQLHWYLCLVAFVCPPMHCAVQVDMIHLCQSLILKTPLTYPLLGVNFIQHLIHHRCCTTHIGHILSRIFSKIQDKLVPMPPRATQSLAGLFRWGKFSSFDTIAQ